MLHDCGENKTENKTGEKLPPKTDALEPFRVLLNSDERHMIFTAGVCLHVIGVILIATTSYMFVRHRNLRTNNLMHLNLLFSDAILLLTDWAVVTGTAVGCDVYSFAFLVFGSSSIYTAVVIAYGRYEQMKNRSGNNNSLNKHPFIWIFAIWTASITASIFPIYAKAEFVFNSGDALPGHMCFFVNDITYRSQRHSITFMLLVILAPITIMAFCYGRIYQNVRRARITRWMNQAAHLYSTHTRIIYGHKRRANIVPIKQGTPQYPIQSNAISEREKHIIIKGLLSVASQLLFWLPFGISWLAHSNTGFSNDFLLRQIYIMLLAKCSVVMNICHYISLNVKFRKYYMKTILDPLPKCCVTADLSTSRVEISHISQAEPSVRRGASLNSGSTMFSVGTNPSTMVGLRPIMETDVQEKSVGMSRRTSSPPEITSAALRSLSAPFRYFYYKRNSVFPAQQSKRITF